MMPSRRPAAVLAALSFSILPAVAAASPADFARVGEPVPEFALDKLVGGDGRKRISEFFGQPVLFAWWLDAGSGMDAARKALKLERKLGAKGLEVVLVELTTWDDASAPRAAAFLAKTEPGHGAAISDDVGFPVAEAHPSQQPRVILIGADGTVALEGSFRNVGGEVEKRIEAELAKRKSGWGEDPRAKEARALAFGQNRLAAAAAVVAAAGENASASAELAAVRKEIERRAAVSLAAASALADAGEWRRAREAFDAAVAAIGDAALGVEKPLAELRARLSSDAAAAEIAREEELATLAKPLASGKGDARLAEKLRKFAEKSGSGSTVARRAERLARVADAIASR